MILKNSVCRFLRDNGTQLADWKVSSFFSHGDTMNRRRINMAAVKRG
jgi:hypothetical protein